jgi:N-methylhydantoinase A
VCYGKGGTRPTVTDADLVLGYLNPVSLLGGALPMEPDRARAAIESTIAAPLGWGVLEAAAGILDVVNAGMAAALRIVSVERGHDPREFALVAFGGAGPVHAARLAQELEIPVVIVPPIPGGFSALGLVASDVRRDYVKTFYADLGTANLEAMTRAFSAMETEAADMLTRAGVPAERWEIARAADCRYGRQAYELTVPVAAGVVTRETTAALGREFHDKHRTTYGHASPEEPVQLVNLRVTAVGKLADLDLWRPAGGTRERAEALPARDVYFAETGLVRTDVVHRAALTDGSEGAGPLVVESADTTVVVPPGWRWRADDGGFIVMTRA